MDNETMQRLKDKIWPPHDISITPPTNIDFYEAYISKRTEFDKNCNFLLKMPFVTKHDYEKVRHVYSLPKV